MDKSSRNSLTSKLVEDDTKIQPAIEEIKQVQVDSESKPLYNRSIVSVRIRSRYDGSLEYTGQASGKQYTWNKAGSVVLVDVEDSEILLAKHIGGRLCCGNSQDTNLIFEIAD